MFLYPLMLEEFFLPASINTQTEIEKAIEIRDQLNASIEWMNFVAPSEKEYQKKSDLLKDITAATRERDRLQKELNKVIINE